MPARLHVGQDWGRVHAASVLGLASALVACTAHARRQADDLLPAGAASRPPAVGSPSMLTTDRRTYTLAAWRPRRARTVIRVTLRNSKGVPVYAARCGDGGPRFVLEQWDGAGWRRAYEPICALVLAPAIAVEPGEARDDTLAVVHGLDEQTYPRIQVTPVRGTYRVVYGLSTVYTPATQQLGDLLPIDMRASNTFQLAP